jgi:sigma-70-like protein
MTVDLEALYRAPVQDFRRVAAAIARDRELGCDAVQEAFAKAVRGRRSFAGRGSLEAWVWQIVVNAARDVRRRRLAPFERRAGCVPHKTRGTVAMWPPLLGWSFDRRVRSGTATTRLGKTVKLSVSHFGGRIDATVFFRRSLVPPVLKAVTLRDANGAVVTRLRLGC